MADIASGVSDQPMSDAETRQADCLIMTADEMRAMQRANILRALETCSGKIAGQQGAAHMLNLKPSTLRSQMKALGIQFKDQ